MSAPPAVPARSPRLASLAARLIGAGAIVALTVALLREGRGTTPAVAPGATFEAAPFLAGTRRSYDHRFRVVNTTDRAVTILDKDSSCTCTHVELSKSVLAPGEAADLSVTTDLPLATFDRAVSVHLLTDHPRFPRWGYHIHLRGYSPIAIEPATLDLGSYRPGEPLLGSATVDVHGLEGEPLPKPAVLRTSKGIRATIDSAPQIETVGPSIRRARYAVQLQVEPDPSRAGTVVDDVAIGTDDDHKTGLKLVWRHVPPIAVAPSFAHFGRVAIDGEPRRLDLIVRATDGQPFRVLGATISGTAVSVEVDGEAPGASAPAALHRLALSLPAPESSATAALAGEVTLRLDSERQPEVCIPWSALVGRPDPRSTAPDRESLEEFR